MEGKNYKFRITEQHGMTVKDKFFLLNKNNNSLCVLDDHPGSNTGLPIVFNTTEEAEHYLMMVKNTSDVVITKIDFCYFDNGHTLYEEDPDGFSIFSFE